MVAFAREARADDAQALEQAKAPFDNGQYGDAHERLSALLDPKLPACDAVPTVTGCRLTAPELVERARALDAASLLALKRDAEANALIAALLQQNPDFLPSPVMFPQEVIERFTLVRASIAPELRAIMLQRERDAEAKRVALQKARDEEQKWIADLARLAARERLVEPSSRWIALVPFGIGQFQNGDVRLGITFAVTEALLGGASLVTVGIVNHLASTDITARTPTNQPVDVTALNANIRTLTVVNEVSFATWAAVTLAGVLQAQIAFVPEKVTFHDRPIPPRPKLVPVATPVRGGAVLGVGGTF